MSKPPPSPPSSDIEGVDRDWSPGKVADRPMAAQGEKLEAAAREASARPREDVDADRKDAEPRRPRDR